MGTSRNANAAPCPRGFPLCTRREFACHSLKYTHLARPRVKGVVTSSGIGFLETIDLHMITPTKHHSRLSLAKRPREGHDWPDPSSGTRQVSIPRCAITLQYVELYLFIFTHTLCPIRHHLSGWRCATSTQPPKAARPRGSGQKGPEHGRATSQPVGYHSTRLGASGQAGKPQASCCKPMPACSGPPPRGQAIANSEVPWVHAPGYLKSNVVCPSSKRACRP